MVPRGGSTLSGLGLTTADVSVGIATLNPWLSTWIPFGDHLEDWKMSKLQFVDASCAEGMRASKLRTQNGLEIR